jgi:hypothetical protein
MWTQVTGCESENDIRNELKGMQYEGVDWFQLDWA